MTDKPRTPVDQGKAAQGQGPREDRLKAALRANMARRKAQARAKAQGETPGPDRDRQQDDE
jgi:hypothetical protein